MIAPEALPKILSTGLVAEDFYTEAHRVIFTAMCDMHADSEKIDTFTLEQRLSEIGQNEAVGGVVYLQKIQDAVPDISYIDQHAVKLQRLAKQRASINALAESMNIMWSDDEPLNERFSEVRQKIIEATSSREVETVKPITETLEGEMDRIEAVGTGRLQRPIFRTGFCDLDNGLLKMKQGKFVVLAARPSVGKTALALNLMHYFAKYLGIATLFFSVDDDQETANQRLIVNVGNVPYDHITEPELMTSDDYEGMNMAAAELDTIGDKLLFDYSGNVTPGHMRSRLEIEKDKRDIKVFIVDFLDKIKPDKPQYGTPQYKVVGDICGEIKNTAHELDMLCIVLHHLNRDYEKRQKKDKRPLMSDLRSSGDIEAHSDIVLLLSCERESMELDHAVIDFTIAKQKNGRIGTRKLLFDKRYQRFKNYSEHGDGEPF